jgi:hypothetical protein
VVINDCIPARCWKRHSVRPVTALIALITPKLSPASGARNERAAIP